MTSPEEMPVVNAPVVTAQRDVTVPQKRRQEIETKDGARGRERRTSAKVLARRAAVAAKLARDARLRVRELDIETALGQFYEGVTAAEEIVLRAGARAKEIFTEAEATAAVPRRAAVAAVRRLRDLGEDRASLAELTGLSPGQVRNCLTGAEQLGPAGRAGPSMPAATGDEGRADVAAAGSARVPLPVRPAPTMGSDTTSDSANDGKGVR